MVCVEFVLSARKPQTPSRRREKRTAQQGICEHLSARILPAAPAPPGRRSPFAPALHSSARTQLSGRFSPHAPHRRGVETADDLTIHASGAHSPSEKPTPEAGGDQRTVREAIMSADRRLRAAQVSSSYSHSGIGAAGSDPPKSRSLAPVSACRRRSSSVRRQEREKSPAGLLVMIRGGSFRRACRVA